MTAGDEGRAKRSRCPEHSPDRRSGCGWCFQDLQSDLLLDIDRRREATFQSVVEQRNRLLKALKLAHPDFCSLRCPSNFTSPDQPRHIQECEEMRAVLSKP
jgi:hypothetical protein